MVKDRFIRVAPFIIGIIAIVIFSLFTKINGFNHFNTFICFNQCIKNLYFVNKNIKNNIIWINQTIDRLLGIIAGCLYLGYAGIVLISQSHVWIGFLILMVTMAFVFI